MSKIAVFKIEHCCLCEKNEMRFGKDGQEFWCLALNKKLNEKEYADFSKDCPKEDVDDHAFGLKDLEDYLRERCLVLKTESEKVKE